MSIGHARILEADKFVQIVAGLQNFRIDTFIRMIEKQKGVNTGKVLPFVRGLRFSALLIYAIRELLSSQHHLDVSWGHILDKDGDYCSRECDIIIHKKGYIGRWNGSGDGKSIMDFRFINYDSAIAVISCKSYLSKSEIEIDYCNDMKKYVEKVWLFAECCSPTSVETIEIESAKHGYEYFWHLYTYNKRSGDTDNNLIGWSHFVERIKSLH